MCDWAFSGATIAKVFGAAHHGAAWHGTAFGGAVALGVTQIIDGVSRDALHAWLGIN